MTAADDLAALRARIDSVDDELLALLSQRAALTTEVGELKRGNEPAAEFYRPEREASILRRLNAANPGPLSDEALLRIMREVISACLALEQALKVAYLGPAGTYTHAAVHKHFGSAVEPVPAASVDEVFRTVAARGADYGVVPIENSVGGSVSQTLDCLSASPLTICGEIVLPIHHQFLSAAPAIAAVRRVYAHEQALAQCRAWLDNHCPGIERVAVASNALAAQRAQQETDAAAIAGVEAGARYALATLAANIEDYPNNTTRFVVLGHSIPKASGDDLTTIMFGLANRPGALHAMLGGLAERGLSMSRIESRPSRHALWEYRFFVDIVGHAEQAAVAEALADMQSRAAVFKLLGSYPRAIG